MSVLSTILGRNRHQTTAMPKPPETTKRVDTVRDVIRGILVRLPSIDRISLVKATYLVQVVHLGRHGQRLIPDWFKATTMGVYDKDVSQDCRYLINRRKYDRKYGIEPSLSPQAAAIIDEVCSFFAGSSCGAFVSATQIRGGAWQTLWQPDPADLMPISDPRRFKAYRRPTDQGPVIGIEHMLLDYRILTGTEEPSPAVAA
jgi:hypothetical protein